MFKHFLFRLKAFIDPMAWVLIGLGLLLFSARVQFSPDGWINFPAAFTVLQTGGLMLSLFGLQIIASLTMWPHISLRGMLDKVKEGNTAAGILLAGLMTFNGMGVLAASIWLTNALGMASAR